MVKESALMIQAILVLGNCENAPPAAVFAVPSIYSSRSLFPPSDAPCIFQVTVRGFCFSALKADSAQEVH